MEIIEGSRGNISHSEDCISHSEDFLEIIVTCLAIFQKEEEHNFLKSSLWEIIIEFWKRGGTLPLS